MSKFMLPERLVPYLNWTLDINNTNRTGVVLVNKSEELVVLCPSYFTGNLRSFSRVDVTQKELEEFVARYWLQTSFNNDLDSILYGDDK